MADHVVVTRDLMDGSRFRSAAPGVAVVRSTDADQLKSCVDSLCDGLATAGFDFTPGGI